MKETDMTGEDVSGPKNRSSKRLLTILGIMESRASVSTMEIIWITLYSGSAISEYFAMLRQSGNIERIGSINRPRYVII